MPLRVSGYCRTLSQPEGMQVVPANEGEEAGADEIVAMMSALLNQQKQSVSP